jgi:hypothetical protein
MPSIVSVTPNRGPVAGGTTVTITGTNFLSGPPVVDFGGLPATGVTVLSDTELTCIVPAGLAMVPHAGHMTGIEVTIHGQGFSPGISVLFGGIPAINVAVLDSRTIRCITPPDSEGWVDVTVGSLTVQRAYRHRNLPMAAHRFWESRFGNNMGTVTVYAVDALGEILFPLYTASGNTGTAAWAEILLPEFRSPGVPYRLAWHYVSGDGVRGDYAIDNVTLGASNFTFPSNEQGFRTTSGLDTPDSVTAFNNSIVVPTATAAVLGRWNRRSSGTTPTSSTGPNAGQSGSAYLYTEVDPPNWPNVNFWLFSPEIIP